jgi:hypothetical protein
VIKRKRDIRRKGEQSRDNRGRDDRGRDTVRWSKGAGVIGTGRGRKN